MFLPKPPVPPLPPPEPPLELIRSIFNATQNITKVADKYESTDNKLKSFFIKNFIPNSRDNLLKRFKIKKINGKTLHSSTKAKNVNHYNTNHIETIITENINRKNIITNETENGNLIRNLWINSKSPYSPKSNYTTSDVSIEKTFGKNDLVFEPIISNSTFYLINVFLFSICLISICFFLLMLIIVTKKCRKSQKSSSGRSSPSSSASSISFVPCYATSFNSSLHESKKGNQNNNSLSSFETSLKSSFFHPKKNYFNTDGSPAKYYTIGDNFLDSNFQLKRANYLAGNSISIPKDSWFEPAGNEYDIIPDNSSDNSKSSYQKYEGLSTFGVNPKIDKFVINTSTIPIVRQQIEEFYNFDQKTLIPSYGHEKVYDIAKFTKHLESYFSRFSLENTNQQLNKSDNLLKAESTLKMFPRTNPFCRNLNYVSNYSSRPVVGSDETSKKSVDANLCSKL